MAQKKIVFIDFDSIAKRQSPEWEWKKIVLFDSMQHKSHRPTQAQPLGILQRKAVPHDSAPPKNQ